jgi:cobalt-zinc-cadmium efflux system protein
MTGHHHHHSAEAGTATTFRSFRQKNLLVTVLNAAITAAELAGGLLSGSLALLSDAVHNFSDTVAVAMSYVATGSRAAAGSRRNYGYRRAEILAAFVYSAVRSPFWPR